MMKKTLENRQSFTRRLMQLLVLMAMLLAPKGAWAQTDYGLTVAGVAVTSDNASSITGQNITGTVSYTPKFGTTPATLTLNGATLPGNVVRTVNEDLIVNFIGSNTINVSTESPYVFVGYGGSTVSSSLTFLASDDFQLTVNNIDDEDYIAKDWKSSPVIAHSENDYDAYEKDWYADCSSFYVKFYQNKKYDVWYNEIQFCDLKLQPKNGVTFVPGSSKIQLSTSNTDTIKSALPALAVSVRGETSLASIRYIGIATPGTLTIAKDEQSVADVNSLTLSDNNGAITGFSNVTISQPLELKTPSTAPTTWDADTKNVLISDLTINYGLTVAGTPVTSANLGNILGNTGTPSVSFTPADNTTTPATPATLTLNGATITGNIEVNDLSALKIKVVGANTITAGEVSAIKSNLSSGACALTFSRGSNDVDCSLTLNSTDVTAISTGFSGPTYEAMALVAEGNQVDYRSQYGLSEYVDNEYPAVTSATITSYTTYDLIINGTTVTNLNREAIITVNDGTISFDGEHTLTLSNIPWYSFNSSYPFIQTSMDLTINLVGTNELDMGNVLIQRNANDNETHTLTFATDETNPGMFIVREGSFSHEGFNVVYNNHLAKNASGYFNGAGDDPTDWVAIPKYGLTIAGVEVTEANAGNVFGEELEEGEAPSVSFTPAAGQTPDTLKLNNASIILEDEMQESPGIIYEGTNNLTISIIGTDNTIQGGNGCSAIRSYAQTPPTLTFVNGDSNPCSLSLIGGDTPIDGFNVSINNALRTYTVTNVTPAVMISSAVQLTLPSLDGKGTITPEQGTYGTDQTTGALIYGYGQTVNLTYHPTSQDYVLTSFKVINSKTNAEIETTSAKSGDTDVIYTFVMPSDPVTVTTTFVFDISNANYTASIADTTYTGEPLVPTTVTLKISQDDEIELTNGTDFDITKYQFVGYELEDVDEPINAGDYYVTIEGKGNYTGTATVFGYKINRANIPSGKYTVPTMKSGLTYTGADQALVTAGSVDESLKDIVELKYYHKSITKDEYEGTGYSFPCEPGDGEYKANVPKEKNAGYYAIVYKFFGGDNYYDIPSTGLMKVAIDTADIANATIEEIADSTYTGKAIKPNPTVTFGQTPIELTANTDYTVAYTNNVNVGKATFTITGKGNFKGTQSTYFNIVNKTLDVTFASGQTWASFYNTTEDFNLPNNVMAYIVTEIGQNSVSVAPINYVPKNVAVLLENNTTTTGVTNTSSAGNLLQGADANGFAVTNDATVYALYNNKMMRVASGTTIPAGKCYLVVGVVNASAPQLNIVFENEGNTTGINASLVNSEEVKGDLYDLQGRKVVYPKKKGLYIQKGRKVVVNNK